MAFRFGQRRVTDPLAQQNFEQLEGLDLEARLAALEAPLEDWHFIGDPTTGAGSTYGTGWRAYGGQVTVPATPNYATPRFRKNPFGLVTMEGLVDKPGGNYVAGDVVLTLPEGYRPLQNLIWEVAAAGGAAEGTSQVRLGVDGRLTIGTHGGPANPVAWLNLTGIAFYDVDA